MLDAVLFFINFYLFVHAFYLVLFSLVELTSVSNIYLLCLFSLVYYLLFSYVLFIKLCSLWNPGISNSRNTSYSDFRIPLIWIMFN